MINGCLSPNISLVSKSIKVDVNIVYGLKINFLPLLVDEGWLFVDYKDGVVKLYVEKYERNNKR